jgi:hypothetical protein
MDDMVEKKLNGIRMVKEMDETQVLVSGSRHHRGFLFLSSFYVVVVVER